MCVFVRARAREDEARGMLIRHLCVLRVSLMSGTFVFACLGNVRLLLGQCAGSILSSRHLSEHRFLDIRLFVYFDLVVVRALGSLEKARCKTSVAVVVS